MRKGLKICPEFTTVYHMNERKGRKIVEKLDERMTEKMSDYS
jgi:hypothetical protein